MARYAMPRKFRRIAGFVACLDRPIRARLDSQPTFFDALCKAYAQTSLKRSAIAFAAYDGHIKW
jgi:hypothetical protein